MNSIQQLSKSKLISRINWDYDFSENEYSKIFEKEEFIYKEYAVYQPMQRDYAINNEIPSLKSIEYL